MIRNENKGDNPIFRLVCPNDYKVIQVSKSVAFPRERWDKIKPTSRDKADLRKGENLTLRHYEGEPPGMFYIETPRGGCYYCAIGCTRLHRALSSQNTLKTKKL